MSYVSPLHILAGMSDDLPPGLTPDELVRLRKRLLAELNLSGETGITIRGKIYTKDTILKTIDQLLQSESLELHDFIYRHTFLLDYLEDENTIIDVDQYALLTVPESIRQKLDLLLSERVVLQFKKGISSRKFAMAERALVIMNFLESNLRLACYEEVHRSLTAFYHFLWELKKKVTRRSEQEIGFLSYESLAVFLNALPDSFSEAKRNVITCCISIVVVYDSFIEHNHALVMSISHMLLLLECDEEQSALIRSNHEVFRSLQESLASWAPQAPAEKSTSPATSNLDYRAFLWLIVAIIGAVFLRGLLSNNEPENSRHYTGQRSEALNGEAPVSAILNVFRNNVGQLLSTPPEINAALFGDTVFPSPGLAPFRHVKFYTATADFSTRNRSLNLKNKTAYSLIVFEYDSMYNSLRTTYIPKGTSQEIRFGTSSLFTFYFGNTLRTYKLPQLNASGEQEFFSENHNRTQDLLFSTYTVRLPYASGMEEELNLTLGPEFLEQPAAEYLSGKIALVRTDEL